jgi:hypothetical protein
VPLSFGGHNLSPPHSLVEIGLTDLPIYGGCYGTPGTPMEDRPVVVCGQKIDCFHLGPEPEQSYHSKQSKQWLHRGWRWHGGGSGYGGGTAAAGEAAGEKCLSDHLYSAAYE